jgi:hypothetical protein
MRGRKNKRQKKVEEFLSIYFLKTIFARKGREYVCNSIRGMIVVLL